MTPHWKLFLAVPSHATRLSSARRALRAQNALVALDTDITLVPRGHLRRFPGEVAPSNHGWPKLSGAFALRAGGKAPREPAPGRLGALGGIFIRPIGPPYV